jgi:hypothetical protein
MRLSIYLIALVLVQGAPFTGPALAQDSEDAEEAATREAYRVDFIQTCRALAGDRVAAEYRSGFNDYCGCVTDQLVTAYDLDTLLAMGLRRSAFSTAEAQRCYNEVLAPLIES